MRDSPDQVIRAWVADVVATEGIDRFDDLHIDRIDPSFRDRSQWTRGMVESLERARPVAMELAKGKTLAVLCSLDDGAVSSPQDMADLAAQFDWSPPSLYLFHRDRVPWKQHPELTQLDDLPLGNFPSLKSTEIVIYRWRSEGVLHRTFAALA